MKILEATTFFTFIGSWFAAENIPLFILLMLISFAGGYICAKFEGSEEKENGKQ